MNISIISRSDEKIDELTLTCEYHPKGELNMVCLDKNCEKRGITCRYCITESHLNHSNKCLPIDFFLKNVYSIRRELKKNLLDNYFKNSVDKLNEVLKELFLISEEMNMTIIEKRSELENEGKHYKGVFSENFKRFDELYKICINNRKSKESFQPSLQNIINYVSVDTNANFKINLFDNLEDSIKTYSSKVEMIYKNSKIATENIKKSFESIVHIDDMLEKAGKKRRGSSSTNFQVNCGNQTEDRQSNIETNSNFEAKTSQINSRASTPKEIIFNQKRINIDSIEQIGNRIFSSLNQFQYNQEEISH